MAVRLSTCSPSLSRLIIRPIRLGVQLIHNPANAATTDDADDGLLFIQDMMELMQNNNGLGQSSSEINHLLPLTVIPLIKSSPKKLIRFPVGPAQFGTQLHGKPGVKNSPINHGRFHLFLFLDFCSIKCCSTILWMFSIILSASTLFSCGNCSSW